MQWAPRALVAVLWLAWLAYWIVAARSTKPARRSETIASRASYLAPLLAGGMLLGWQHCRWGFLSARFVPNTPLAYWLGTLLLAAGLIFASWGRRHLADNWSSSVALMQDHELIRSGPYAIVRHPIYTGLLVAILGTAIVEGEWRALVAVALFAAAFVRKLAIEERFLAEIFPEQYARYRTEVPTLIPPVY